MTHKKYIPGRVADHGIAIKRQAGWITARQAMSRSLFDFMDNPETRQLSPEMLGALGMRASIKNHGVTAVLLAAADHMEGKKENEQLFQRILYSAVRRALESHKTAILRSIRRNFDPETRTLIDCVTTAIQYKAFLKNERRSAQKTAQPVADVSRMGEYPK